MTACRIVTFLVTLVVSLVWAIPSAAPDRAAALAQTAAAGPSVSGDFKGAGYAQIATLYDAGDNLGLRILVMDRNATSPTEAFTSTEWFSAAPGAFDLGRMKITATDANFDGKTDLVALYDDGGTSVRLLVFLSTGSSFTFTGTAGWWRNDAYSWQRTKAVLSGNFSAVGRNGLLLVYQYDNFQMRIHYLESNGAAYVYTGNAGVYDSGPGQYDTARARFAVGRFTRTTGPDQIASIYQYPSFQIRVHVFDPMPSGLQPINGWDGVWSSDIGLYDLSRAKIVATDFDGDGRTDLLGFYYYDDGSVRVHVFSAKNGLALVDTSGVAQFAPFTMPWYETRVVAGDWNKDGRGDLASLTALGDGSTHVGTLRSNGAQLVWTSNSWVTPSAQATATKCKACWPLNGLPTNGNPNVNRRVLAVKIDNAPPARPHYGISQADLVVELLVEGFVTRLAAYFHSQDPGMIGAVRSARFSDRYTTPMVRGVLVCSGASQTTTGLVFADVANGSYVAVSPQFGQGNAFYRTSVDGRVAPYNLFTTGADLRRAAGEVGGGGAVQVPVWDFFASAVHTVSAGGFQGSVAATNIEIPYRSNATVRYQYDGGTNTYGRWQSDGRNFNREVDAANNVTIAARNIVIINTDVISTNIIEDAGGAPSLDMRLVGSGPATVFRDGRRQDGVWYRPNSYFEPFMFLSNGGERIYISQGQTWIHIVPMDWQIPSS